MRVDDKNNKGITKDLNGKSKYWLAYSISEHVGIRAISEDEDTDIIIRFFTNKAERNGFVDGAHLNIDFRRFDLADLNAIDIFIYNN